MYHSAAHRWLGTAVLLASSASTVRAKPGARAVMGSPGLGTVPEDFSKLALAPGFLLSLNVLDDSDFGGTNRIKSLYADIRSTVNSAATAGIYAVAY
jgi:hypothetical protein